MAASGITVLDYDNEDVVMVPVATATVIERGDPISYESGAGVLLDSADEDASFVGIALDDSQTGDTRNIRVASRCFCQVGVTSATYDSGVGLLYVSGDATTVYVFADDSGANTIAWAAETKGSAVTSLKVLFDAVQLSKLYEVNA